MKKFLILYSLFFIVLNANAQTASRDWEKEYKSLCSYDKEWCGRLKDDDGSFVKPKADIAVLLRKLAPKIHEVSKKFGVDPIAVAGSILAENTLNVNLSDRAQDLIFKLGMGKATEALLGKKMTIGLGQLNIEPAMEAERYAAKLEGRKPKSEDDIRDDLLIPERAIYLVAALTRLIKDDYAKNGFDLSGKPEILSTVYNLGNSNARAAKAKAEKRQPRVNFFGFFVDKYKSNISKAIGPAPVAVVAPVVAAQPAPSPSTGSSTSGSLNSKTVNGKQTSHVNSNSKDVFVGGISAKDSTSHGLNSKKEIQKSTEAPKIPQVLRTLFNESTPLTAAPTFCKPTQNGKGANREKYEGMKDFRVTAIINKGEGFSRISGSIDCEGNDWSLIKSDSGKLGWLKNDVLSKNSSEQLADKRDCKSVISKKCSDSINEKTKSYQIVDVSEPTDFYLKPYSNTKNAGFKNRDESCGYSAQQDENDLSSSSLSPDEQKKLILSQIKEMISSDEISPYGSGLYGRVYGGGMGGGYPNPNGSGPMPASPYGGSGGINTQYGSPSLPKIPQPQIQSQQMPSKKQIKVMQTQALPGGMVVQTQVYSLKKDTEKLEKFTPKEVYKLIEKVEKTWRQKFNLSKKDSPFSKDNIYSIAETDWVEFKALLLRCNQQVNDGEKCSFFYSDLVTALGKLSSKSDDEKYTYKDALDLKSTLYNEKYRLMARLSNEYAFNKMLDASSQSVHAKNLEDFKLQLNKCIEEVESYGASKNKNQYLATRMPEMLYGKIDDSLFLILKKKLEELMNYCHSLNHFILGKNDSDLKNQNRCEKNNSLIISEQGEFLSKEVYSILLKENPNKVKEVFLKKYDEIFSFRLMDKMSDYSYLVSNKNSAIPLNDDEDRSDRLNFCPNKTAEFIEDLLTQNECIKSVQVPDYWLITRLNEQGSKVVYRPYEKDDRYSIDMTEEVCK